MAKWIRCDCPHPHDLRTGTEVRVEGEGDQPFFASGFCTRGRTGRDYTQLEWMLADPRKKDEPGWPIIWAHHSKVRVVVPCFCGHPERTGIAHRSHECLTIGWNNRP